MSLTTGFSVEEISSGEHPRTAPGQSTASFLLREKQNPFPRADPRNALHGRCKGFGRNATVVEAILTQPLLQAGAFAELLWNSSPRERGLQVGALGAELPVLGLDVILAVFTVVLQGEAPDEGPGQQPREQGRTPISPSPTTLCARRIPVTSSAPLCTPPQHLKSIPHPSSLTADGP